MNKKRKMKMTQYMKKSGRLHSRKINLYVRSVRPISKYRNMRRNLHGPVSFSVHKSNKNPKEQMLNFLIDCRDTKWIKEVKQKEVKRIREILYSTSKGRVN